MHADRSPLPRLTPAFWGWALLDLVGVLILTVGAAWLIQGRAAILPGFPAHGVHAWSCVAGGGILLFVAAVKMMVEVMHATARQNRAADDNTAS